MPIPSGFVKFRSDAVGFEFREKLKSNLTIIPESTSSFNATPEMIRLWAEDGDFLGIPRGVFNEHVRTRVDEYVFEATQGSKLFPADPISLRDGQEEIISSAVEELNKNDFSGVILEAKTGGGKTVLALETCRRIGQKVLVVVHTSVLADQWVGEIQKFFPTWRIGRLQADKIDIKDKDIVIGMVQSCSMKEYPEFIYKEFGTLVVDEAHICGAPEFGKVLQKFTPKHIVGLTGTIKRADKAENVFIYGIGRVIRGMNKIKVLDPQIYLIDTGFAWWSAWGDDKALDKQKPHFLKAIVRSAERNEIIVRQAVKAASAGRNVLILGERVGHIEDLAAEIRKRGIDSVGVMVGSTSKKDREISQSAQVICATNQLVGTGFNEPRLDVLIFATPLQAVEQPVGRVLRQHPDKKQPLVLDLVDSNCHMAMVLAKSRYKKYSAKGWQIHGSDVFKRWKR
jgi:superfamily II DNA or RNA helicase